jgi:adenosylcobinamide-GDP ribazoletransferase
VTGAPLQRRFLPVAECPISAHRLQHQLAVMDDDAFDRDRAWPPDFGAWWSDLRVAAAFLTRLPIRQEEPGRLSALPRAARCFPLVGLGIGLAAGVVYAVAIELVLPPILAAVLAVAAAVLVTGALHEDGLADTADGFGGGGDREAKLRIMRDSRIGTYGVAALLLAFALRVAGLAALGDSGEVVAVLIACHAASRAFVVVVMWREPSARSDGLAASAGRPGDMATAWAAALGVLVTLVFVGLDAFIAIGAGAAVALLIARLARRQIGGITGDVLGAVQQGTEVALLLAIVAQA